MNLKLMRLSLVLAMAVMVGQVSAGVLFEDDFESYAAMGENLSLDAASSDWSTAPWATASTDVRVGSLWPGLAYYSNNYYGDTAMHFAHADLGGAPKADYTVKVDVWKHESYPLDWYVAGRVNGDAYVAAGAVIGSANTDGTFPLYMRLKDSDGNYLGDYWMTTYNPDYPVTMEVTLSGDVVSGTITHGASTLTLSMTTTVLAAGDPGFGGQMKWPNYSKAYFDNFEVSGPSCGDPGMSYLPGDANHDCYVNMLDFADVAAQWLNCTDPQDSNCDQYWK